jgi:hypothetical protein
MLPAQIPLTLEHLFPTPSNSNVRTARRSFFYFYYGFWTLTTPNSA